MGNSEHSLECRGHVGAGALCGVWRGSPSPTERPQPTCFMAQLQAGSQAGLGCQTWQARCGHRAMVTAQHQRAGASRPSEAGGVDARPGAQRRGGLWPTGETRAWGRHQVCMTMRWLDSAGVTHGRQEPARLVFTSNSSLNRNLSHVKTPS